MMERNCPGMTHPDTSFRMILGTAVGSFFLQQPPVGTVVMLTLCQDSWIGTLFLSVEASLWASRSFSLYLTMSA